MSENKKSIKQKYGGYSPEIFSLVPAGARVLDIGCSTGGLAKRLKEEKGCRVVGVDVDHPSLDEALPYCEAVLECDLDRPQVLREALQGRTFDVITLGDVLEHLQSPNVLLKILRDYLIDEGCVIASIPNAAFALMRLRFLLGDFSYSDGGGLMDEDHLRFFDFKTARRLFVDSGYDVERIYGVNKVRKRFLFLVPLAKILPSLFAIHIIIVARKEPDYA